MADWRTLILPLFSMLLQLIVAEENKYYVMSPCYHRHPSFYSSKIKIDGAVIQRGDFASNLDCTLMFESGGKWLRFMIHFESLNLKDCSEYLSIFDSNSIKLIEISCSTKISEIKPIMTNTGSVTVKYKSGTSSKSRGSHFRIIITAFRESVLASKCDFRCSSEYCIDDDLVCDKINHCGDNSDELRCRDFDGTTFKILGLGVSIFIVIMVCIFIVCSICIIGFILCLCRKSTSRRNMSNFTVQTSSTTTATPVQPNLPYPRQPGYPYIPPNAYTYQPENPPPYPGGPYPQQRTVMYDVNREQIYYYPKQ